MPPEAPAGLTRGPQDFEPFERPPPALRAMRSLGRSWHKRSVPDLRWTRWCRGGFAAVVAALVAAFVLPGAGVAQAGPMRSNVAPALARRAAAHPSSTYSVIIRERHPASATAEALVRSAGGRVTNALPLIGAFAATIPGRRVVRLAAAPAIQGVSGNGRRPEGRWL